jgi:hypothetical protein
LLSAALGLFLLHPLADAGGDKGTVVKLSDLKSTAPADWKEGPKPFKSRLYTFYLPKAGDEEQKTELQIISFGASGGGLKENIERWKGQFDPPTGKNIDEATKVEDIKVPGAKVVSVDIQGTYLEKFPPFAPNAKTIRRPDYRRINIYFEKGDDLYFFVLVGPAKTVDKNRKAFDEFVKGFK